jgi:hypothetical protein
LAIEMKWVGEGLGFVGGVDVFGWIEHKVSGQN